MFTNVIIAAAIIGVILLIIPHKISRRLGISLLLTAGEIYVIVFLGIYALFSGIYIIYAIFALIIVLIAGYLIALTYIWKLFDAKIRKVITLLIAALAGQTVILIVILMVLRYFGIE
ncbi:MAG: hypothetical protein LBM87_01515 [Ruminococcus sp.]|jgi:hypothetical protein|nr:hypothetical protein [Ruminococcus sp.]